MALPGRLSEIFLLKSFIFFSFKECAISVSIKPGATAFTLMPKFPTSFDKVFVNPIIPAFEVL